MPDVRGSGSQGKHLRRRGTGYAVPRPAVPGIRWPAIPTLRDANVLALLDQFERSEWWPPEVLLAHQLRQLENLLVHAARTVPLYRERLDVLAPLRRGGLTLEKWRQIPVLRRAEFQDVQAEAVSNAVPESHGTVSENTSSGSLGRPVTLKVTGVTGMFFAAINLRYHLWHGRDLSATACAIQPLREKWQIEASEADKALPWVPVYQTGRMYYLDSRGPVRQRFEWLIRHEPQYLLTQPSNLRALIQYSRETGRVPRGLSQVSTLSEIVDPALRDDCAQVWGAIVCDVYSCEELGLVALQCPDHPHYHVQSESVFVEVLNEQGEACAPGETGRVVATDLHNFATPLIRYEIGDYAEVGAACPCGRGLPVLSRIMGRYRNMLTLPSGGTIWPSYPASLFLSVARVRQRQLIQHDLDEIEVKLVVAEALTAEQEAKIAENLTGAFGHPFRFRFTYSDDIPTGPGGKFEDFISKLPDA